MKKQGDLMNMKPKWMTGVVAAGIAAIFLAIGAREASAQYVRADTYEDFAVNNGFATRDGTTGVVTYDANMGAFEDRDGDGLVNSSEWYGYSTVINGTAYYFGWRVTPLDPGDTIMPGSLLDQLDSDWDGVPDFIEYRLGTNPRSGDTDEDGMPDVWEIFVGLDPRDDGETSPDANPHNHPDADPDGDGLTNMEELTWGGFTTSSATQWDRLSILPPSEDTRYTLPLNFDTSGDGLIDSFKVDFMSSGGQTFNPTQVDDRNDDPDRDGLTTYREQCMHPLLAQYWRANGITSAGAPPVYAGSPWYGNFGTRMLVAPGYMHKAQYDGPGNQYPVDPVDPALAPGNVIWGHPVLRSPYAGVRRWTSPFQADSDGDSLPDGWEVEYGLNPLSGSLSHYGHFNPSGALGDPDGDGKMNIEEYFGQDGYRIDFVTGTGDETNPWIARLMNNTEANTFANTSAGIGQPSYGGRQYQSPQAYLGVYDSTFTGGFDPGGANGLIGFFDPVKLADSGEYHPIPGVPPPVSLDDRADGTFSRFNPFATAMGGIVFRDAPGQEDGVFTPGADDAWLDVDGDGIFTFGVDVIIVDNTGLVGGEIAVGYTTENVPYKWPMPGRDTDDDGYSDSLEIERDIAHAKYPSAPVLASDPFSPKSMRVLDASGILLPSPLVDRADSRHFARSFTIECWVYLEGDGSEDFRGSFIRGQVHRGGVDMVDGYNLGVRQRIVNRMTNNAVPTISFQTIGGNEYTVQGGGTIPMNRWVHLAGVFEHEKNALSLYIDGLLEQSRQVVEESSSGFGIDDGGLVYLAQDAAGSGDTFAGNLWMDEVRIWGVPRSAQEVAGNRMTLINPYQEVNYSNYPDVFSIIRYTNLVISIEPRVVTEITGTNPADVVVFTNYVQVTNAVISAETNRVINTLLAYYTFDDGGTTAQDFTKRAKSSLVGYAFPHDRDVVAYPRQEYLYADALYGLTASRPTGPATGEDYFAFDRGRVAPVRGMVDAERGAFDSDGDGLPDAWELVMEFNPFMTHTPDHNKLLQYDTGWAATTNAVMDAQGDPDGDGLPTIYEYWARTNPRKQDTDENGIPDSEEDFDGDGLPNRLEAILGSRPDLADTDDNQYTDAEEQAAGMDPTNPLSPSRFLSAWFDGKEGSYLEIPIRNDLRLRSFTLQANVLPSAALLARLAEGEGATILRKVEQETINGMLAANYELRLVRRGDHLTPLVRYIAVDTSNRGIIVEVIGDPVSNLTARVALDGKGDYSGPSARISATYSYDDGALTLYLNNIILGRVTVASTRPPLSGKGPRSYIRLGEGFEGVIHDVRIWDEAKSATEIATGGQTVLAGTESGLMAYYRFDDGAFPMSQLYATVIDQRSVQPAGVVGERYIVGPGATGADWTGQSGSLAEFMLNGWSFQGAANNGLVRDAAGRWHQYDLAINGWQQQAVVHPSVSYLTAPTNPKSGDSWLSGNRIVRFNAGAAYTSRVDSVNVFCETSMARGTAQTGDFAFRLSEEMYYRCVDGAGDVWHLWGPHRYGLSAAMATVKQTYPTLAALLADRTPEDTFSGDEFLVLGPSPAIYSYTMATGPGDAGSYDPITVYEGDRVLDQHTTQVLDYLGAGGFRVVATAATDGGGLFIHVNLEGVAFKSDGTRWMRWGFIPNFQDFTVQKGWMTQWSKSAWLYGNVKAVGFDEGMTHRDMTDSDGDGMPDWWEIMYGLNPYDATDAGLDPDGDGLTNLEEYWCNTNPHLRDTSGNGIPDGDEDYDGDGLTNLEEVRIYGTRPDKWDTDDDGFSDGDEVNGSILCGGVAVSSPRYSRSPLISRSMIVSNNVVTIPEPGVWNPDTGLYEVYLSGLSSWAVGCWYRPDQTQTGSLIKREISIGGINFDLRLDDNVPSIRFTATDGTEHSVSWSRAIPNDEWTALMGYWQPAKKLLTLYVNDVPVVSKVVTGSSMRGAGTATIGDTNLTGLIDDVYVGEELWDAAVEVPDYVIVMDVSGSMSLESRMVEAKNAALEAIASMPESGEMAIITFDSAAQVVQTFTSDKELLKSAVERMQPVGGTDYNAALTTLRGLFTDRDSRKRLAIFVSDGEPNYPVDATIVQGVVGDEITVHTIGFGAGIQGLTAELEMIARETGGNFYAAPSGSELRQIMQSLVVAEAVAAVGVFYPFDDGGEHAEDFIHQLDWNYALRNIRFANEGVTEQTMFNWMFTDSETSIPAWWADFFFGEKDIDPDADPDHDGLINLDEYLLGLNPKLYDSTGDGISDGDGDADGDGILNRHERSRYRTHPGQWDTDDDGLSDGHEVDGSRDFNTVPRYSRSPLIPRSLVLDGTPLLVPEPRSFMLRFGRRAQRFEQLSEWFVGVQIRPDTDMETGVIASRYTINDRCNFELRLDNNIPSVIFESPNGATTNRLTAGRALPGGQWTTLMAEWMPSNKLFRLCIDDVVATSRVVVTDCATGPGKTRIGAGLNGRLDDLYIGEILFSEQEASRTDYALVLDVSGSMGSGTRMSDMKSASRSAIEAMPGNSEMAIVSFHTTAALEQDFTSDKEILRGVVNRLEPQGLTSYEDALQTLINAYADRDDSRKRIVIFISDGAPTSIPQQSTLDAAKAANIVIYTVGFGSGIIGSADWLESIAEATDGKYYEAPGESQLAEIMVGVIGAQEEEMIYAFYPFDDGGRTAEDFANQLNWDYAIRAAGGGALVFAEGSERNTKFNWMFDDNENELPKWWTDFYFHGESTVDPKGDADGDGVNNLNEYLIGTDPRVKDSTGDGIEDGYGDFDGDGLSNAEEQLLGTSLIRADTDDDGISDKDELDQGLDPTSSLSPFIMRYLQNDGTGWMAVPKRVPGQDVDGSRFNLPEWTIETMVRLAELPRTNIVLVGRYVEPMGYASFELGIGTNAIPYVRFQNGAGGTYRVEGYAPLELGEWVSLGGRYGKNKTAPNFSRLSLFQDYREVARDITDVAPISGSQLGDLIVGRGLVGDIDEVRVWNESRSNDDISRLRNRTLLFGADVARMGALSPGGDRMYQTSQQGSPIWTVMAWVRTSNDADVINRRVGNEYNFGMAVEDGQLKAYLDFYTGIVYDDKDGDDDVERTMSVWGSYSTKGINNKLADGNWHHLGVSFDGSVLNLYVDGVYDGSVVVPPDDHNAVQWKTDKNVKRYAGGVVAYATGSGNINVGSGMNGLIDELAVFHNAWSYEDFKVYYRDRKRMAGGGLHDYFDFDEVDLSEGPFVENRANLGVGILVGNATIESGIGDNAPVNIKPLEVLARKLAGYWPMDDGRWTNNLHAVEDFSQMGNHRYAGSLQPSFASIDFVSLVPIPTNMAAMSYPKFFPHLLGTPWELDSDGDGMPDIFEQYFGFNPSDPTDAFLDLDGDGLNNLYEYWANLDPRFHNSDGQYPDDPYKDSDGDGVVNIDEQNAGTHPGLWDTDDDGLSDGHEFATRGLDPLDSMSPYIQRALRFSGAQGAFADYNVDTYDTYSSFTVEAWVAPARNIPAQGYLVMERSMGVPGITNYALGIDSSARPYILYNTSAAGVVGEVRVTAPNPIPLAADAILMTNWTHIAATYDSASLDLKLFVNGVQVARRLNATVPANSADLPWKVQRIGEGYTGLIDEVRVWNRAVHPSMVFNSGSEEGLAAYFRFDDGTSQTSGRGVSGLTNWTHGAIENYAYPQDWKSGWKHAANLHAGVSFVENVHLQVTLIDGDADNDRMPDSFEMRYPGVLDPVRYDPHNDPDGDGWDNLSEYQAGTSPADASSVPRARLAFRFMGLSRDVSGDLYVLAYNNPHMDGTPSAKMKIDASEIPYEEQQVNFSSTGGDFTGTLPDMSGKTVKPGSVWLRLRYDSNRSVVFIDDGSGVLSASHDGDPLQGTVDYTTGSWRVTPPTQTDWNFQGINASWITISPLVYPFDAMAGGEDYLFEAGHLRQGDTWFFGFVDQNGNGRFDEGEPAGLAEGQPVNVQLGETKEILMPMTPDLPGYKRISWETPAGFTDSYKAILGDANGRVLVERMIERDFIHEGDYRVAGYTGLSSVVSYRWYIYTNEPNQATAPYVTKPFSVSYAPTLVKPVPATGNGAIFRYARNQFAWSMDTNATVQRLVIRRGGTAGPLVYDVATPRVFVDRQGVANHTPDILFGDLDTPNGDYYWQVILSNPGLSTASDWTKFTVRIQPTALGPYTISGDMIYAGLVTNGTFIIEAFHSSGFGGKPQARTTLRRISSDNDPEPLNIPFELVGLHAQNYYVKGYLDLGKNGMQDVFDSYGFVTTPTNSYLPGPIMAGQFIEPVELEVLDVDSDGDLIPDAWEWYWYGSLDHARRLSGGGLRGYSDFDGDGLNDYEEFLLYRTLKSNPLRADTAGDGVSDSIKFNLGLDLSTMDTDGDGFPDWLELMTGNDPTDPDCFPEMGAIRLGVSGLLAEQYRPQGLRRARLVDVGLLGYEVDVGLEGSDDLSRQDAWHLLDTKAYSEDVELRDPEPNADFRFYRLIWKQRK